MMIRRIATLSPVPTASILAFFIFLLLAGSPVPATCKDSLVIGILPEMNVFEQSKRFRPLGIYLTEELGREVRFTILSRYGNIIESLRQKEVDGAFLGSFTGALAIRQLGVEPLARPINPDGRSTYCGHIFVRRDSGIKAIEDMRGKTMAFVEQATTAGYIFPLYYLQSNGVKDYRSFFGEYFFTGSHDAAIDAVVKGEADVGAAKNTIYDRYVETHPLAARELVILATSEQVPSNGLCVRGDMEPALKERLKKLLLGLKNDPEGARVLQSLHALDFVETGEKDYQPVVDMAHKIGISLANYGYNNQ